MRHSRSARLAFISVMLCLSAAAAARPRYGGALRVEMSALLRSLDPTAPAADAADAAARRRLLPLVYETLVAIDSAGGLRPLLATAWESEANATRWRFRLRSGVVRHDGALLDARQVAASLGARPGTCKVSAGADTIAFDCDRTTPDLPWQLADLRHAVTIAQPTGAATGTGPFAIERRVPGRLLLRAHDAHWGGRPFLDSIEIRMARPALDQVVSLEAGRADIVDVRPQDVRRVSQRLEVAVSRPTELIALVFTPARASAANEPVRRALALSVDRDALCNVVLQRHGQPAATLLPPWLSGYAPLIGAERGRSRARTTTAALPAAQRTLTLALDRLDALLLSVAERLAVDAREAGLTISLDPAALPQPRPPDLRLVRSSLEATTPDRALNELVHMLGLVTTSPVHGMVQPAADASLEAVHRFEAALLDARVAIPLVHLPQIYGVAARVDTWIEPPLLPSGAWNFASVWLRTATP